MDFKTAVEYVNGRIAKKNLTDRDRTFLYGMYKQANFGNAPAARPVLSQETVFASMKWLSWKKFYGVSKQHAEQMYCAHVAQMRIRDGDDS